MDFGSCVCRVAFIKCVCVEVGGTSVDEIVSRVGGPLVDVFVSRVRLR